MLSIDSGRVGAWGWTGSAQAIAVAMFTYH